MIVGASTDIGIVRQINQDFMFASKNSNFPLFIVADGMGGHRAGEVASEMAVSIIINTLSSRLKDDDVTVNIEKEILDAIKKANNELLSHSQLIEDCNGMGTTITLGYINEGKLYIGHVGDSRAYLIRRDELIQLTDDHSLVNELLKNGEITHEEAMKHPQKNVITRAVGTNDDISIDINTYDLMEDDIILFCSDGLTNMVEEDELKELFINSEEIQVACDKSVIRAKEKGGRDNITVIGIRYIFEVMK